MSEFYNPNNPGGVNLEKPGRGGNTAGGYAQGGYTAGGYTAYDEPAPELNIVVDDGPVFCSRCGNPIEHGDAFCSKCGAKTYGSRQESAQPVQQSYSNVHSGIPMNVQGGVQGQPGNAYDNRTQGTNFGNIPGGGIYGGSYQNSSQTYSDTSQNYSGNAPGGQPVINNYYYNNSNNVNNVNSGNINANVNMNGKVKDKYVALGLCIGLGYIGVHRFYEGKIATGLLWLFTGGLFGVGWIIDLIILICKKGRYYNP